MKRFLIIISFIVVILISLFILFLTINNKEWQAATASISLIIAVISAWIAYETFYRQTQSQRPQVTLELDFKSRYDLVQLVAKNYGQKPAFNIKIEWENQLLNSKGKPIIFNKSKNTDIQIPVLNRNEQIFALIDKPSIFFERYGDQNLDYKGRISFQESLTLKKRSTYPFYISFEPYRDSLKYETEELKTHFELQKIPEKLESIQEEIRKLTKTVEKPDVNNGHL